jgi:hypothetical protein
LVIKLILLASGRVGQRSEDFQQQWRAAFESVATAPPTAQPRRVVACFSLPELLADPVVDGVGLAWFDDRSHLAAFEEWSWSTNRLPFTKVDVAEAVLVADEVVLRGAEWLDHRWAEGGDRLKHIAIARRASGLSPAEFSQRWRAHAGILAPSVPIPEAARGQAYVQNHPRPDGPEGLYDAVNEVYFDDLDSLRFRIEWLAANQPGGGISDLFGESWSVAVREEILWPGQVAQPGGLTRSGRPRFL